MLQGHFIDTLLATEYRDSSHIAYKIWAYFRGITAPTFFTISGLIFTYLLLKAKANNTEGQRMRKGLNRGILLIGIGYLLRIPFFSLLMGNFSTYFLATDVLQIIGLSLICIVILYYLCFQNVRIFSMATLSLGLILFVLEPLYRGIRLENIPLLFSNYISKVNGSVFTIIPWFGYVAFGAYIATIFYKHLEKPHFKPITLFIFCTLGYALMEWSGYALLYLSRWTGIQLFLDAASYNYLFPRLGNVFIYFMIFFSLERYLKIPLLLKIGQKTLSIYVIHFIIIYGSFTGVGLRYLIGKTLTPWEAVFGAVLFLVVVCFISFYYAQSNTFLYKKLKDLSYKVKGR